MGIEMLGSRMLAPYFGTDIFVWANLIGIVLLSVSLGNYFGGKLSSKKNTLLIISAIAVVLLLYIASFYKGIFEWISEWFKSSGLVEYSDKVSTGNSDRIIKPLFATVIVFFPLVFCLSMISPILIKRLSGEAGHAGKVSGRVYAISTIGNLFGTFFTSFYLIVKYKTTTTLYVFFSIFIINIILITLFGLDKSDEKT